MMNFYISIFNELERHKKEHCFLTVVKISLQLCCKSLQCHFSTYVSTHFHRILSSDVRPYFDKYTSSLFEVAWKGGTKQRLHSSVCQLAYEIIPLAKVFDKCCMWTKS